jgi:hypothetical protein
MLVEMSGSEETTPIFREATERFWVLRLTTEVRHDGLYVRFNPIQRSFRRIPVSEIDEVDVTTYSSGSYGGWHWGVRWSLSGDTVYRLRGNQGIELDLKGGQQIFIGSQSPHELETGVREVMVTA